MNRYIKWILIPSIIFCLVLGICACAEKSKPSTENNPPAEPNTPNLPTPSVTPEKPEDKPSEPTEPQQPVEPEKPVEPETPTEPEKPTQPSAPTVPETPTEPSEPILPDIEDFPKYDPELFENIIAVDVERGLYVSRADGTVWRGQLYVDEDFNFDKAEFELSSQVPAKKLGAERYANVIITENGDLLGDFEKVLMENVVDAEMTLFDGWALCEDGTLWIYYWDTIDNPTKYAENIAEYWGSSLAITKDRELVNITRQEDGSYVSVVLLQGKKIKSAMGGLAIDENNTLWTTGGKKIAENARFIKSDVYRRDAFAVTENNELWINGNKGAEKIANDVSDAYYCRIDGMGEVYFLISPDGELSYIKNGERIVIAEKVWHIIPPPFGVTTLHNIKYLDNNGRAWTYFLETEEKRLDMENVIYAESGSCTFYICADGTLWADGHLLLTDVKLPATTEPDITLPDSEGYDFAVNADELQKGLNYLIRSGALLHGPHTVLIKGFSTPIVLEVQDGVNVIAASAYGHRVDLLWKGISLSAAATGNFSVFEAGDIVVFKRANAFSGDKYIAIYPEGYTAINNTVYLQDITYTLYEENGQLMYQSTVNRLNSGLGSALDARVFLFDKDEIYIQEGTVSKQNGKLVFDTPLRSIKAWDEIDIERWYENTRKSADTTIEEWYKDQKVKFEEKLREEAWTRIEEKTLAALPDTDREFVATAGIAADEGSRLFFYEINQENRTFEVYHISDYNEQAKIEGHAVVTIPEEYKYDSIRYAAFGGGGGSSESGVVFSLKNGNEEYYLYYSLRGGHIENGRYIPSVISDEEFLMSRCVY